MRVVLSGSGHSFRLLALAATTALAPAAMAAAQPATPIQFGGAESFAVIAKHTVSNTGASVIGGDAGVGPGGTINNLPLTMLAAGSSLHEGDAVAAQALRDARSAWTALAERTCPALNKDVALDGATLDSGVYCFTSDATLTTTLTLSGTGPWIFQVPGTLTIGPGATVVAPLPGARTCRGTDVHWQIGDSDALTAVTPASIGAGAAVVGNIVAEGGIAFGSAATLDGRAFSIGAPTGVDGGAVTLNANTTFAACSYGQPLPTHTAFKVTGGGNGVAALGHPHAHKHLRVQ